MLKIAVTLLLVGQCLGADLVDTLVAENTASTLVQLVTKAGLVSALKSGTFTIFAPTDAAFARVPSSTLTSLLGDNQALANLLKYHVVAGTVRSTDLKNEMTPTTLAGSSLRVNIYTHNKVNTINGKTITEVDRQADNGVIHFIDDVIMPPSGNAVDAVKSDPELSTLLTAVSAAGIAKEFLANPETVFAPTNAAFAKLDQDSLKKLLGDAGRLRETLEYHAVPHTLYAAGLWNHEFPKSSDSHEDRLHIRVNSEGVTVNNAKVIEADINVSNGVVHKIDSVLIPIRVAFWLRSGIGK